MLSEPGAIQSWLILPASKAEIIKEQSEENFFFKTYNENYRDKCYLGEFQEK